MTAASNADAYAAARVGVYFQGFPSTLDGQCVSLIKWFLGDMCGVSNWQAARGDAKDFGDTLVEQGLADLLKPGAQHKRGDIVVWKQDGGGFGHIGVLLSGDRVFEENVGLKGTPSKMVGAFRVYSSRIDPLVADWRTGSPTFYRVKNYIENKPKGGDILTTLNQARIIAHGVGGFNGYDGKPNALDGSIDSLLKKNQVGQPLDTVVAHFYNEAGTGINWRSKRLPAVYADRAKMQKAKDALK